MYAAFLGALAVYILAVQPLSRNDISILAQFFETSFDYHIEHESAFYSDYLKSLRTLIGLGFAAALADRSLLCIYQTYLDRFLAGKEGDFKAHPEFKTSIAQCSAEMVGTAAMCFSALGCPQYYQSFIDALYQTIVRMAQFTDSYSEAERILGKLTVK